ncbi:glycosyltransferase [Virgibacillus litoralis]|uniref:Glycosyltransferase involved in cell wall biosynthesis n=1 Tax=Virgibacillus litoralis TaxID=578221 RepID=A0ABS4HDR9_9BACI|nr:glycosyltransferase [Virgibacillus litoralis]MBP1949056.1 glycosyltransferase involved in cell wall biosynthesis [Virgibacillus litoralis]
MKEILIASFDMEVGGVERSLISMLDNFDYSRSHIDLMLYSHTGDLIDLLPDKANLLEESNAYNTFRKPIGQILKSGRVTLGLTRLMAKYKANKSNVSEPGYRQMQFMWKYALPFLPRLEKKYDTAISYLWPHYVVAEKVEAKTKIAWIHTDFSTVETDINMDLNMWRNFNYIVAVSVACKTAFIKKYPSLKERVIVIENITSPDIVKALSNEKAENPMTADPRFKVITVARLSHAKGIDNAVRALKLLKDRGYDDIVWYVVGYGGDQEMLEKLIAENDLQDSFILLGKQTNPYTYLKEADLYVQPSRYEGKAVTVGEAQILGKPVLITNYPTANSQVNDGIDGMICDLSAEGIADGIETLYSDKALRDRLAANCSNINFHNSKELEKLYELI